MKTKFRYRLFVLFCWLFSITLTYAQQERGIRVVTKDPETGLELNVYNNMWAVVIGIDKYQYWQRLRYAVKDADAVARMLTTKYGFNPDHIILLKDNEATLQGMKDALQILINKTDTDDGVLFYFAGHGQTFLTKEGKEMGFLIPVDGKLEDEKLYTSSLSMSEVKTLSNLIPAKHILFLVDACYSGLAASADYRGSLSPTTKGFLKKVTRAKTRHIITAGSSGEQVQEREEWGHSAFTYELLNALERELADENNDEIITADELAGYLTPRVSSITNNSQLPISQRLSSDDGKFVFVPSQPSAEYINEVKREETEKSDANKKVEIVPHQTKDIIHETEFKIPTGFYIFYGIGITTEGDTRLTDLPNSREHFGGKLTVTFFPALLPAVGYRLNNNLSFETRLLYIPHYSMGVAMLDGKINMTWGRIYPFLKLGWGIAVFGDEKNINYKDYYFSLYFGSDIVLSDHFSISLDWGGNDNISVGGLDFVTMNTIIRYHF